MSNLNKAGKFYFAKGWNVIPVNFKKALLVKNKIEKQISFLPEYQEYHEKKITEKLIDEWWGTNNAIAVITGKISGLTVIDLDLKDLPEMKDLPETFTVETNKGYHFYFNHTEEVITHANNFKFKNSDRTFNIDIRNNGGIVFAAPSEYELPDGKKTTYKIIKNLPLADLKREWLENIYATYELTKGKKEISNSFGDSWKNKIVQPMVEGSRNNDFTSIVGGLLNKFPQNEWESIVWTLVNNQNSIQTEPLPEYELRQTFNSIAKKEAQKRNTGGEIKDIITEATDEEISVRILLAQAVVCFKAKNFFGNLFEATVYTWIEKPSGLSYDMPFYLKIKSDSNKEAWARVLSKAYDKKEDKEVYPWTILVSRASKEIEKQIKERRQDFSAKDVVEKKVSWMYEPFIQEDQINTFFGLGSSGKTLISMYFSTELAKKGINTMLIDYENDSFSWKYKISRLSNHEGINNLVYYDSEQIPVAEQVDKLKEVIKKHNIKLVIVDSASMASGDSTTDEKASLRLTAGLKLLKTTVVLIAHQRKNDGDKTPIGSIQYENQARNVWNFKSIADENEESTLHIACTHTKSNNTYLRKLPVCFKIVFDEDSIEITNEDAAIAFEEKLSILERIKNLLFVHSELKATEIADELGIKGGTIKKTLSVGKRKGLFINESEKWSLSKENDF